MPWRRFPRNTKPPGCEISYFSCAHLKQVDDNPFPMHNSVRLLTPMLRRTLDALRDLVPLVAVIAFFQIVVLQQPFPDLGNVVIGLACVCIGLALFIQGLESGLFPLGEVLARGFASKGSLTALLSFAFCLGFGTTIAEPALIAVSAEAADVAASAGAITDSAQARSSYALQLRLVVAIAVGAAVLLGVLRILKGWPIHLLIIGGYVMVTVMTAFAPDEIIGIAYDAGGVTTSTITVRWSPLWASGWPLQSVSAVRWWTVLG